MNTARADALAARRHLALQGWIPRRAEWFRHLPPPGAEVWLGDGPAAPGGDAAAAAHGCDAHPLAGAGWTLHPVGDTPQAAVAARWLDAADATQRAALLHGLPLPGDDDAAPFAWAHRALCRQGLRLRIGEGPGEAGSAQAPVWLQLRHQPRSAVEAPLLVIELQAGVHCVLVERHERAPQLCRQPVVQNLQVHLRLGEGARLQHLRITMPGEGDRIAHHLQARLARGARYEQALVATGSAYHLQRSQLTLAARHTQARLASVLFAAGSALEQQLLLDHAAAHTTSDIGALVLASGRAQAVVNARTHIAAGADEASARQRLSGIPTGGAPRLVLRPQLEILHDQVQASHGATWGALPEDALFYAQQRGLDPDAARGLIVAGLAQAVIAQGLGDAALLQALALEPLLAAAVARHLATAVEAGHG
ncbi:MAG: SufD family Fe-S cluster assembly protein [Burkholderiales bacterium]|nr:SufD family Fe-S cluster assembly protein [Burkholderiales bacterium]